MCHDFGLEIEIFHPMEMCTFVIGYMYIYVKNCKEKYIDVSLSPFSNQA